MRLQTQARRLLARVARTPILQDRRGATAVEYGLIIAMIVLAIVAALTVFADATAGMWNHVSDEVTKPR